MSTTLFNPTLTFFSVSMCAIGILLAYITVRTQKTLPTKCIDKTVHFGLNFILMLSVMLMVFPLIQLICNWGCKCYQIDLPYKHILMGLLMFLCIVGFTVFSKLQNNCDNAEAKKSILCIALTSLILSILFIFGNIGKTYLKIN